jgi:uncharacterized membrane protein YfcA
MDIPTLLPVLASLIVIGGFAGFLAGLLGVGGGIVLVPAFFYAFQSLGYDGPSSCRSVWRPLWLPSS